tara:strand:- start:1068 stop:1358 length:291 start_codon:yes stop_codon:yes gene_type:complete
MGFLFSAPKIPAYTPPPAPEPAVVAPTTPAPTKPEETFAEVPLDADLPQSPEEVQARAKAVQQVEAVRKRRRGVGGMRIPLNPGLSITSGTSGVNL